jgi:hypothetical protein
MIKHHPKASSATVKPTCVAAFFVEGAPKSQSFTVKPACATMNEKNAPRCLKSPPKTLKSHPERINFATSVIKAVLSSVIPEDALAAMWNPESASNRISFLDPRVSRSLPS